VSFSGHGTDADGTIAAYNWRSSIDGQLSTLASFSSSALAAGAHTIFFKVRDNLGAWSPEAQRSLQVNSPSGPVEVILDNGQPGTSSAGTWKPSGSANWFGTDSLYADDAGESYTFQLNLPQAGTYDVYAWWTRSSSRRPDVPVDIVHAGGTATVVVNQQVNGGVWNRLGSWSFGTGPTGLVATVTIRSLGGAASPNTTCADAVRLVRTAP
jgi:hypothetical protein